ncbi:MAG TPA: ABC transporter permease, partial [Longimicrobiales bacterium]|nr:ABC transporter permease [Longimicrobiales bacterium]
MLNDIRLALRSLIRTPALTLVVVLCLGLGVGANTTIFSFTSSLFLRPLPVNEPDQLVRVYSSWNQQLRSSSFPEYTAVKSQTTVFAGVAAYRTAAASVGQGESTTMERVTLATGDYFQVVSVTPAAGRFFTAAEDRRGAAEPVAVVSHAFWQTRLRADPAAIGRSIHISGRPYTVVGVAPATFFGLEPDDEVAAWLPFMSYRHILGEGERTLEQGAHGLAIVARLRPGVRVEAAQAAAGAAAQSVVAEYGSEWKDLRMNVLSGATLVNARANPEIRVVFILLNAVVGFVLLIACANIANVLLARGMSRRREIGIRLALGSGRVRLLRQLLVESVLLGLGGGLAGLLLALWGTDLLRSFNLPAAIDPSPDGRVLVYTLVVAVASGIIFGVVPGLQATRVSLADTLKQSTRMGAPVRSRLRGALVVSQISLSVLLLALAGLFLRAIFELRAADNGVDASRMLAVHLDFRTLNLDSPQQGAVLADRIQQRIAALPGVEGATLSTTVPSGGRHWATEAHLPEHDQFRSRGIGLSFNAVGPDYLKTLGVPLMRGRALSSDDGQGQPRVAVVNQAFVRQFFPN